LQSEEGVLLGWDLAERIVGSEFERFARRGAAGFSPSTALGIKKPALQRQGKRNKNGRSRAASTDFDERSRERCASESEVVPTVDGRQGASRRTDGAAYNVLTFSRLLKMS